MAEETRVMVVKKLFEEEHECYLKWRAATTREDELYWINKHKNAGDAMTNIKKEK